MLYQLPTHKIQCPTNDIVIYVDSKDPSLVKTIFFRHNIEFKWQLHKYDGIYTIAGKWRNEHKTYEQTKKCFFELAKQKSVFRIF